MATTPTQKPLSLTLCALCARSRPDFAAMIERLQKEFPEELRVVSLSCMAACDEVPAVMIETDYFPQISAQELRSRVITLIKDRSS